MKYKTHWKYLYYRELCITHISLKRMGFSSVPRLSGWSFQQRICGGVLPPPHCPDKSGPAVSPTDTLRKDSALTPVTSEKSTLFIGVTNIVRFSKALKHYLLLFLIDPGSVEESL
jgi:hypothetical protein